MKIGSRTILIALFCIWSVQSGFKTPSANAAFTFQLKAKSDNALIATEQCITDLHTHIRSQDLEKSLSAFHRARRNYKSFEYLYEYFHHSAIKRHINGAPLPQLEPKVATINVFPPQGFQRMEELLYEATPDWAQLSQLAKSLSQELENISTYHQHLLLYDRHVLEATRYQLIRLYTLGLTGFENPASDSTLSEVKTSFLSLRAPLAHYAKQLSPMHHAQLNKIFDKSINYFETSFDDFDRLGFLREIHNPLFELSLNIHLGLGIETFEEVNTAPVPTNYAATRLFDINLLNRDFFLKYPENEITDAERELGRVLFYDPALSFNNSMACVSCHHPDKAFTDGLPKSISNDQSTEVNRNAPTLVNALFAGAYFHDLRAGKLTMQTEHVMANPKEFNVRPLELAEKLNKSAGYKALFQSAYPGLKEPIQPRTIQSALASYVASLVSWNSPFDRYARGEADTIDPEVVKGYNLFMGKASCGTCHFAPNFNGLVPPFYDDTESEVLGVPATNDTINPTLDADLGRIKNGKRSEEAEHFMHSFKTPTVRNIALTAPYFHNGAYPTLEEVMWFYNQGGGQGIGIAIPNQTLPPDALGLSKAEISAIIAFMNSLTDAENFIKTPPSLPAFEHDPALSNRTAYSY